MSNIEDKVDPYHPDFDWFAFLNQNIELVSEDYFDEANSLANNWVTCACGQLCKVLPRGSGNCPADDELYDLGMDFAHEIENLRDTRQDEDRLTALETLNKIEARTTLLLQQMKINS
jgi:hypothetical protein